MAKEVKKEEVQDAVVDNTSETAQEENTGLATTNKAMEIINISPDVFLTSEQMNALLSSKDVVEEKLTAQYLKGNTFAIGEERKFIFMGVKRIPSMKDKSEDVDAVILFGKDDKGAEGLFINAASMVAGEIKHLDKYTVVGLTYKGSKPAKVGTMDVFNVSAYHQVRA